MLMDRIVGAFLFRRQVYKDVEADPTFTQTAWIIVAVVAFLSALGTNSGTAQDSFVNWLLGSALSAAFAVLGFAVGAWVVSWVGQGMFGAEINFGEAVRTLGLAYVWNIVGILGILGILSPALLCITGPFGFGGSILAFIAFFFALQEALDLSLGKTILVALAGWVAIFMITLIGTFILASIGILAGTLISIF